jgi:hypothetical protein
MVSSEAEMQQMLGDLGAANVPRSLGGTRTRPAAACGVDDATEWLG